MGEPGKAAPLAEKPIGKHTCCYLFFAPFCFCRYISSVKGLWLGGREFGERWGRDTREGQKKGGRIKIKTTVCSPLGPETLPFTGWHSPTISVPWQSSARSLWTVEQLQAAPTWDHPCTEEDEAQHTLGPPLHADRPRLSLHLLLPCKHKRPFTAEVQPLLLGIILGCSVLGCRAIVVQNIREAQLRNYRMQALLAGSLQMTRVLSLPSLLFLHRQNQAPEKKKISF